MSSNSCLETAAAALTRYEVPQYLTEQRQLAADLHRLEQELALAKHQAHMGARIPYYANPPDQENVRGAETRRASKRAALETVNGLTATKIASCYVSSPPLEIVHRVEIVIGAVLADQSAGVQPLWAGARRLAGELDRIAERVAEIWAPGVDLDAIVMSLRDDGERARVMPRSIPGVIHPTLGWAPIDHETLLSGAALVLQTPAFAAAVQTLAQSEANVEIAEKHRETARANASVIDRMVVWREAGPNREELALLTAQEALFNGVEMALTAFVPLGIHAMAAAASAALRGVRGSWEYALSPMTGALLRHRSRALRAIVLATLVELRQACERAFPGLPALVWAGSPERMKAALHRTRNSPYRRPAASEATRVPPSAEQRLLFDVLDARGLEPLVARGVIHAARLGVIERRLSDARESVSWIDRATFWSERDEAEATEDLEERAAWHVRVLMSIETQALRVIEQATLAHAQTALYSAIVRTHVALEAIQVHADEYGANHRIVGCPETIHALRQLSGCWGVIYGLEGDRSQLVSAILRRLSHPPLAPPPTGRALSFPEVVDALAVALQPTEFAVLAPRIGAALAEREQLRAKLHDAHRNVSAWDELNVLTQSDAEQQRGALSGQLLSQNAQLAHELRRAELLLEGALATYAPAALYFGIPRLIDRVAQIQVAWLRRDKHNSGRWLLNLGDPASRLLREWTVGALRLIGTFLSPSETLEQFVVRDLT